MLTPLAQPVIAETLGEHPAVLVAQDMEQSRNRSEYSDHAAPRRDRRQSEQFHRAESRGFAFTGRVSS